LECFECLSQITQMGRCDVCGCTEPPLTEREKACLQFLDDKLYAGSAQVGRHIYNTNNKGRSGGSNLPAIGAAVLCRLKKRDLVRYLPDCGAWRISRRGREALELFVNT